MEEVAHYQRPNREEEEEEAAEGDGEEAAVQETGKAAELSTEEAAQEERKMSLLAIEERLKSMFSEKKRTWAEANPGKSFGVVRPRTKGRSSVGGRLMVGVEHLLHAAGRPRPRTTAEQLPSRRAASARHQTLIAFPRSLDLSSDEHQRLQLESQEAAMNRAKWQTRGPLQEANVGYWRGQRLRPGHFGGTKRFAKRGGRRQDEFGAAARRGELMPTQHGAVRCNPGEAYAVMYSGHDGFNSSSPANGR